MCYTVTIYFCVIVAWHHEMKNLEEFKNKNQEKGHFSCNRYYVLSNAN